MSSWLDRIGQIYDVSAQSMLDEWLAEYCPAAYSQLSSIEYRLTADAARQVAPSLRVTDWRSLTTQPRGWVVEVDRALAVCPQCLRDDDQGRQVRYRRSQWMHCWRVTCSVHRCLLVQLPNWQQVAVEPLCAIAPKRQTALGGSTAWAARRPRASGPPFSIAIRAVQDLEAGITRAFRGRPLSQEHWGPIEPADFLTVVDDVCAFVLTNFTKRSGSPLCTKGLGHYADHAPIACFARQPSRASAWSLGSQPTELAHIADVGLRRSALYWTRELMHAFGARDWTQGRVGSDRVQRQAHILQRQSAAGIAWLADRMEQWPSRYRWQWWLPNRALRPPA